MRHPAWQRLVKAHLEAQFDSMHSHPQLNVASLSQRSGDNCNAPAAKRKDHAYDL
eukprot:SAG11_NODE_8642_length_992_cov_1.334826_1_plen_54_part_01